MKYMRLIHKESGGRAVYSLLPIEKRSGGSKALYFMDEWERICPNHKDGELFDNTIFLKPDYIIGDTPTFEIAYINEEELLGERFMDKI